MLLLLPAQPVVGRDALGAARGGLEPGVELLAQPLVLAHALGEGHVGKTTVEALEQLAQGAQPLQLTRSEYAIARSGPRRLDQADALQIAQHSRRPAGCLGSLVDGQPVHTRTNLSTVMSRLAGL